MQVTVPMLVYSLMYIVALTVDALVVVDTPESTLLNTEVKNLLNGVYISMGLQFSMEIVLFYVINPLPQHSIKAMLQSRAVMSAYGKRNFWCGRLMRNKLSLIVVA